MSKLAFSFVGQIAGCYNRLVDILEGLNPAQKEAVTWVEGPLLIVAGPSPAGPSSNML